MDNLWILYDLLWESNFIIYGYLDGYPLVNVYITMDNHHAIHG